MGRISKTGSRNEKPRMAWLAKERRREMKPDLTQVIAEILKTLGAQMEFNSGATKQLDLLVSLITKLETRIEKLEKEKGK